MNDMRPPVESQPSRLVRTRRALNPWVEATNRLINHDGLEIAGSMAFSAVLTLFPFLILLFAIAAFFHVENTADDAVTLVFGALPSEIASAVTEPLRQALASRSPNVLTLSALVALWSASNGVESLRTGLNRAYGVIEMRHFIWRRLESLAVVLAAIAITLFVGFFTVASTVAWSSARESLDPLAGVVIDSVSQNIVTRYLIAGVVLGLSLTLAHLMLPGGQRRVSHVLPGVLVTTLAWLIMAAAFSIYLAQYANYTVIYGGLSGIAAAMVFFYFSAIVVLFGAELNRALLIVAKRAGVAPESDAEQ
ncbi:MAG: YihY family inner membrane protein [Alphaproteobacteria bacterium]|nr:YihY family inner membrane protein [Alphaproteobacteria bacterium]